MIKRFLLPVVLVAFLGQSWCKAVAQDSVPIGTSTKIWDAAPHNAFTDLVRFNDRWYCVFREGQGHVSPDGALRVITSVDGETWESAALITSENSDLRDAKITVTPDGQLMLCGAESLHDKSQHTHQSLAWFSKDGRNWSEKRAIGDPDFWLWRVTWHEGKAYGIGYGCREDKSIRLYSSQDGKNFETLVERLHDVGYPNETSIVFSGDTAYCLLRRDGRANEPNTGLLGISQAPFTDWEWKDLGTRIGGPHMIRLPDGRFVAAVRLYDKQVRTSLCWIDTQAEKLTEFLALPSGGDTSYAGIVLHENQLWVSYYSSHEGKTNIYLSRTPVPSMLRDIDAARPNAPQATLDTSDSLLEKSEVYPPGLNGIARYRIPGVVVTSQGTVLAYCEARKNDSKDWGEIEVHLRRSIDGGKTWLPSQHIAHKAERIEGNPHRKDDIGASEQTVNNPVAIIDRETGAIEFLYCVNYAQCFSIRSTDDGVTWSAPEEITSSFEPFRKMYDWKVIATGPGHGIQLNNGRLVVPIWLAYGGIGDHGPSACGTIFSDDHGKTWQAGDIAIPNNGDFGTPNESILATLSDDRVMMVSRNVSNPNRKLVTTSTDGATNWSQPVFHEALWEPVCMASLVAHPSGALLFSNPHTLPLDKEGKPVPAGRGKRENLSIKLSRDDGKTWPVNKTLEAGSAAYSDLAVLPDGTVLCLFERGNSIDCVRFNFEWLGQP